MENLLIIQYQDKSFEVPLTNAKRRSTYITSYLNNSWKVKFVNETVPVVKVVQEVSEELINILVWFIRQPNLPTIQELCKFIEAMLKQPNNTFDDLVQLASYYGMDDLLNVIHGGFVELFKGIEHFFLG